MSELTTQTEQLGSCYRDFPGLDRTVDGEPLVYLDNAATTLKPLSVVEAMNDYNLGIATNIHRGKSFSLEEVSNRYEQVRYKVANLIGCSGNEVVFTGNTTQSLNMVAHGLALSKEDRVICFKDAHHSNLLPWMAHATVDYVDVDENHQVDMQHYQQLLATKPKVVALNHCSNVTGYYIDLAQMVSMAKQAGALVVVDAAQSLPHRKVNVSELDIDFLAFSAHKMGGPTGVGVLYGKSELLRELKPLLLGGGMVDWVETDKYVLRKIPHSLEAGTPNISGVLGLGAAIDYLNSIGFEHIEQHDRQLAATMLAHAASRDYLEVIGPSATADKSALLTFAIKGIENLDDVARYLSDSNGILVRNGHLCAQPLVNALTCGQVMRISGYLYNSEQQVAFFFDCLDQIVEFMR